MKNNVEKFIAKRLFSKKRRYKHTKRVVKLCKYFSEVLEVENRNILIKAAWLHDIGKIESDKKHHKRNIVIPILEDNNYKNKKIDDIVYIIENHKGKFNPDKLILESAILRMCDKLDKYNKIKKRKQEVYV